MAKGWFLLFVLLLCAHGCSSAKTTTQNFGASAATEGQDLSQIGKPESKGGPIRKLWTHKLDGLITDMNLSGNGRAILVATAPDRETGFGGKDHWLYRFDLDGHLKWKRKLKSRVKAQTISHDGSLAVYSSYDDQLTAIDSRGRELWKMEGVCKPILLGKVQRMLCYHDDDAEPEIAFDVFDWKGRKILSYPIDSDVLSLKVSRDERHLVIGLSRGQVILFDQAFKSIWQTQVDGEVVDVSASVGSEPRVAVLSTEQGVRRITLLDSGGRKLAQSKVEDHVEQIELSPDGSSVIVYGNSLNGQVVALFSASGLQRQWRKFDARPADYSSPIIVASDFVIMGHEDMSPGARQSRLLAFDFGGAIKWNLPLVTEEGAYLYAQSFSEDAAGLAVGTDDGNVGAFRFTREGAH